MRRFLIPTLIFTMSKTYFINASKYSEIVVALKQKTKYKSENDSKIKYDLIHTFRFLFYASKYAIRYKMMKSNVNTDLGYSIIIKIFLMFSPIYCLLNYCSRA